MCGGAAGDDLPQARTVDAATRRGLGNAESSREGWKRMTQDEIANEITYRTTVDAYDGVHPSGTVYRKYQDIRVSPSDNPGYDPKVHDLTNPEERAWWARFCSITGEYLAVQATRTPEELNALAVKAGYLDWNDVQGAITEAIDDDVVLTVMGLML